MTMRVASVMGVVLLSVYSALGQTASPPPAFDVASVKLIASGGGEGRGREMITTSPSGVTMRNVRLKSVVAWAYHLQAIQIVGPGWLDSDVYDVVAKAAGEAPRDRLRLMMQTLLADRFKLTSHQDTKEMPAYVISVAKSGLKIKESAGEGEMDAKPNGRMGAAFTHVTLERLIEMASPILQGVVVDQTGLKGVYDFNLDMAPLMAGDVKLNGPEDAVNLIIQAANDQLGIKIEQKRVPAERLLLDHIERTPVQN